MLRHTIEQVEHFGKDIEMIKNISIKNNIKLLFIMHIPDYYNKYIIIYDNTDLLIEDKYKQKLHEQVLCEACNASKISCISQDSCERIINKAIVLYTYDQIECSTSYNIVQFLKRCIDNNIKKREKNE